VPSGYRKKAATLLGCPQHLEVRAPMTGFLMRRAAQAVIALFGISLLVFVMMFHTGDPAATLLPPSATDRQRQELREALRLDDPPAVQYLTWLGRVARG